MFENWAKVIGGILSVAGISGFLENLAEFYSAADNDGAILRTFIAAWWSQHEHYEVSTADLWPLAREANVHLGDGEERSQKIRLGKLLAENRDRTFALDLDSGRICIQVTHCGTDHRAAKWALRSPG